ncbi:hypothetical protein ACIU1J_19560 [Azospirillum doebereinerae]|uniref:hypothetical protein n=1 Tax=Azospirillum doebereinerae TaxID=92933 RepID=UPI001EE5A447|nr:hypothetical protein [Azospirillum doebereinerae]MCG5241880.1 hypothetical protein [Azospirillum doebereinerae]
MAHPTVKQAADAAVSADLAAEARIMLFNAALTVGDPARIQAARQDAEDAFAARLDAHAALYGTARLLDGAA